MAKPLELTQRWPIVVACHFGIATGVTGLPFYTLGLFVGPLEAERGWSRGETQVMFTLFTFVGLACVPLVGTLVDRYGVRPVALTSMLGASIGFALLGYGSDSLSGYYLCGALLAVLAAGTSPISWTRAIGGWFDRQRGLALGLALAGTGLSAFLAPAYVAWLTAQFSWQTAYLGLATLPLLAWPVVYALLREPPPVSAIRTGAQSSASETDPDLPTAMRSYRFWVIALGFFAVSMGIGGSIPNLVPLMTDAGIARADAAALVGGLGLSVIGGRLLAGWLIDRLWAPGVAAVMLAVPAVSALLLAQETLAPATLPLAVALIGLAAGAEFDLIAYLVSRYFGMTHYAKIYALLYMVFMFGAGIAPPLFGYWYDAAGSYRDILYAAAGAFVLGASALLTLGRYPDPRSAQAQASM